MPCSIVADSSQQRFAQRTTTNAHTTVAHRPTQQRTGTPKSRRRSSHKSAKTSKARFRTSAEHHRDLEQLRDLHLKKKALGHASARQLSSPTVARSSTLSKGEGAVSQVVLQSALCLRFKERPALALQFFQVLTMSGSGFTPPATQEVCAALHRMTR